MWDDVLNRAIANRFAPDIMEALRSADSLMLARPHQTVNVPLYASVGVVYDADLAAFTINATIADKDPKKYRHIRQLFSTREFFDTQNKARALEYLFDDVKVKMLHDLAEGHLSQILRG